MKNKMKKIIFLTILFLFLFGCSRETVSDNSASNSENSISNDMIVSEDSVNVSNDSVLESDNTIQRDILDVDLAFEATQDISFYDYKSVNGVNDYILKDDLISTGTLIHAYRKTSDGYYQVEFTRDGIEERGYVIIDDEALVETDIAYVLSNIDEEFEVVTDYTPHYGPGIYYEKCKDAIEKGTIVNIIAITDNGWFMTEDGYFISNNVFAKDINEDNVSVSTAESKDSNVSDLSEQSNDSTNTTSQSTTTDNSNTTDSANTNSTSTTPVVAPSGSASNSGITEVQARDKVNTFLQTVYPEGTTWGWDNSYTAYNGKKYWACDGFAYMLSDYIFGNAPYTSIPVDISTIRIGDILTTTVNNGHRCVCIGIVHGKDNQDFIMTADGNCDGKVTYKLHRDISEITGVVTRYSDTNWRRYSEGITGNVDKIVIGYVNELCYAFENYYYPINIEYPTITLYYGDGSVIGGYCNYDNCPFDFEFRKDFKEYVFYASTFTEVEVPVCVSEWYDEKGNYYWYDQFGELHSVITEE